MTESYSDRAGVSGLERHRQFVAARRRQLESDIAVLFSRPRFAGIQRVDLEIGCGHGHWLTAYAAAHPERRSIGIDLLSRRIERAKLKVDKRGLENVAFLKAEAHEFLQALPESVAIDRCFLLFLDPWPKKRHHKNRLIQTGFLRSLAARSCHRASLFFRTDHTGYFEWTVEHLKADLRWDVDLEPDWPFEAESYFQSLLPNFRSLSASLRSAPDA